MLKNRSQKKKKKKKKREKWASCTLLDLKNKI